MMASESQALSAISPSSVAPSIKGNHADGSLTLAGQQIEADQVTHGVGQGEDFDRHSASGLGDSLAR